MVFGLFSRKPAQQAPSPNNDSKLASSSTAGIDASLHGLRTPSPSVASGGGLNAAHSPAFSFLAPGAPADAMMDVDAAPNADALYSLVRSVPPKVLHEYLLEHLYPSLLSPSPISPVQGPPVLPLSSLELNVLTTFFSTLAPPPLLHCARCHSGFFDVENSDRSCTMAHDDDAAEVERVGKGRLSLGGEGGARYETLWGCCGRTVEGDGDMGPPDGWCYEGKHTTDTKRARFRADSTPHDDKLTRCNRHCPPRPSTALNAQAPHPPPSTSSSSGSSTLSRTRNSRKRTRSMAQRYAEPESSEEEAEAAPTSEPQRLEEEAEEEEEAQSSTSSSAGEAIVVTKPPSPKKPAHTPQKPKSKPTPTPKSTRATTPSRTRSQSRPRPRPKAKPARVPSSSPAPAPVPTSTLATPRSSPRKPATSASILAAAQTKGVQRLTRAGTSMNTVGDSEDERAAVAVRGREKRRRVGA